MARGALVGHEVCSSGKVGVSGLRARLGGGYKLRLRGGGLLNKRSRLQLFREHGQWHRINHEW
jgi:hypothetical protein